MDAYVFDKAQFTYCISNTCIPAFNHRLNLKQYDIMIQYTSATQVLHAQNQEHETAIIGYCVDAHGEIPRIQIPSALCQCTTLEDAWNFCDRLAGKYVICYLHQSHMYVWGDATCSIPLNYGKNDGIICISPFDKMTAATIGVQPDEHLVQLRQSADPSQAMPYDWTPYKNVKALFPNRILDLQTMKATRMRIPVDFRKGNTEEIIQRTLDLCKTIGKAYAEEYDLVCPLTAGYDSRAVLAIMRQVIPDIPCFTIKLQGLDEHSSDVTVPRQICDALNQPYQLDEAFMPSDALIESIEMYAGLVNARDRIVEALVFQSAHQGKARLHGDIMDQIGRASVMNSIPCQLVTPSLLQCKIHNTDTMAQIALGAYIEEIRQNGDGVWLCDLFPWENRCGRWEGQEESLYALCGMISLNIFNCREIILQWMRIPRKYRKQLCIYKRIIAETEPRLFELPVNPGNKVNALKKAYWPLYYLATYVKQLLLYRKRKQK